MSASRTHRRHESSRDTFLLADEQEEEEGTGDQVHASCPEHEPSRNARYSRCKCMYMYTAHASTGGPRVIRCFPRPTDRQHLLQVHTLEIESTNDARPRETTFNAPFLCTCSFSRPSSSECYTNSVFPLYRDCYIKLRQSTNGERKKGRRKGGFSFNC